MTRTTANEGEAQSSRGNFRLRLGAEWLGVVLGLALVATSCDAQGDGNSASTSSGAGSSGGGSDGNSTSVASADSQANTTSGWPGDGTSSGTGHVAEDGDSASESTTASENPIENVCPTATSEMECARLDPVCRWYPSYHVLDPATCLLEEPEYRCWATNPNGQAGCFDGPPASCDEMGIRPLYRETSDGVELLWNTEWLCNYNPLVPEGEPAWVECPIDEFRPAPDVCYCLCGGPPDAGAGG